MGDSKPDTFVLTPPGTSEGRLGRVREEGLRYAREWADAQDKFPFDEEWLFVREEGDRTYHTVHRFHPYFAMSPPPLIAKLISQYSQPGELVLDSFCGAGVTAVEAMLQGRMAYSSDISPLACLVTKVKTTPIDIDSKWLDAIAREIHDAVSDIKFGASPTELPIPHMHNIDHWFRSDVQLKLGAILQIIQAVGDSSKRDFLLVAFSSILRKCSTSQNLESHLRVRQGKKTADPIIFIQRLYDMVTRMRAFEDKLPASAQSNVECADARLLSQRITPDSVDLIVTSPPYGTTSKYTSIYKLSFDWLKLPRPMKPLENSRDFLTDLTTCMRAMHTVLRRGRYCCLIYGTNKEYGSRQVMEVGKDIGFAPVLAVSVPVIDASKSVRGDYRRFIPTEHILVLHKAS